MDCQDQKATTAISAGHEGHGVHTCHRCGWPFPNPHPSAKHRRAHKKVCGTIEGFKIIQSEDSDSHLAVSVEENASDDDVHTPSPTLVERKSLDVNGSGGIGERSSKSEDDEFCDAVAEFSDGGKSQTLDSRFDSVIGIEKSSEQTGVEFPSQLLKVDETDDKTELIDPTSSGEISNPGAPTNANDRSEQVVFLTDNVDIVNAETLVGLRDSIQPKPTKEDILASETTESENKISDPRLTSLEGKKDVSDNLTSHMVEHADFLEAETPGNIDTAKEQSVANSVEIADSTKTAAGNILSEGTHENSDTSMVEKVSDSAVVEDTSIKLSDEDSMGSFLAKDDKGKTYSNEVENVDNSGSSGVEKQDTDGNINENLESDDKFPTETISATGLVGDSFTTENDLTACTMEQIVNNCDGKSNDVLSDAGNEMGSETSEEILRKLDHSMPSESSNPLPFSHEVDTNAIYLDESSKTESTLELRDTGLGKSFESNDTDKETETQSVGSAGLEHDAVDSVYKNPPNTTSEDSALPVISELPKSNDMPSNVIVESINVGGLVYESEQDIHVATSEKTLEHPISKDSISLSSETVDAAEVINEQNLDRNIVADNVKSDNSVVTVHEALPVKEECTGETITETNGHESEVVNAEKSYVPVANLSSEDRQPTSPSGFQDSQKTYVKGEDENTDNLEHDDGVISKPLQDKSDEKVTEEKNDASANELSGALSSRCDSLEANYGSVSALSQSSDTLETKNEKQKQTDIETSTDKSEVFEPPSFMTLVQPSAKPNQETGSSSEIGMVQHNQSDSLQAGWFPSLSNLVNESEGRKKNEEIIAKVTNWSPVKQHSPLKTLLNEAKSPNTKQVATSHEKQEGELINKGATDSTTVKPFSGHETKNMDEWDSPARYPIETKKEKKKKKKKKKKKPYWVPFVCCSSSVHGDL